jgi:hypothetical protein
MYLWPANLSLGDDTSEVPIETEPYVARDAYNGRSPPLFLVDWLKGAIPIEKETCVLGTKEEAIAAAKTRAPDVIKRHSGREPDRRERKDCGHCSHS